MECNDVWELSLAIISRLCSFTQSYVQVLKMCWWGAWWRQSVCGSHWGVSSDSTVVFTAESLHTKTTWKLKSYLVISAQLFIIIIIESYWRSVLPFFNGVWCYLGFPQPMMIISLVSLLHVVEVKRTQYISHIWASSRHFNSCGAPQLTTSVSNSPALCSALRGWATWCWDSADEILSGIWDLSWLLSFTTERCLWNSCGSLA